MPQFFDLHSHMLCGVDDGAGSPEEMYQMLEMAYADGIRAICLTPHYSPYLFGNTTEASKKSFALLKQYVAAHHPDMRLFLGHELGYHHSGLEALDKGLCRTINGGRYVLVDFPEGVDFFELSGAMENMLRSGYRVILAHTERYHCLARHMDWLEEFVENGGLIQVNASSATGSWGKSAQKQWKKLVKKRLVHIVSTDAHNLTTRLPVMTVCLPVLEKYCDPRTVRALIWDNACRVVRDEPI